MIVKLISILSLIGAAVVSASSPPKFFVTYKGEENAFASIVEGTPGNCTIDTFLEGKHLCLSDTTSAIISKAWTAIDGAQVIGEDHIRTLLHHYAGLPNSAYYPPTADMAGVKAFAAKISKKNVDKFTTFVATFALFVDQVSVEVLSTISNLDKILEATTPQVFVKTINHLSTTQAGHNWLKDNAGFVLKGISDVDVSVELYVPKVFAALFSDPDNCDQLTDEMVGQLAANDTLAKELKADCMEKLKNPVKHACNLAIRNLSVEIFKKAPTLDKACYKYLTADQVAVLDSGKDASERCRQYPLVEENIMANGSKMRKDCFEGAVSGSSAEEGTAIRLGWSVLPVNVLEFEEHENYARLKNEFPYLPASHKAAMFAKPDNCEHLPESVLRHHGDLEISTDCFLKLNHVNQVDALINSRLNEDVLAKIGEDQVSKWEHADKKGLAVLDLAMHVPNIGAIIEKMSSGHQETHACATIESFNDLKDARAIQLYADKKCFDAMEKAMEKISLSDLKELEVRAQQMVNMNEIVKGMDDRSYRDMEVGTFKALQNSSNICAVMTADQMGSLPEDCLKIVEGKCLEALTVHEHLEKKHLQHIPATAFVSLEADVMNKIPRAALSPEQFGQASSAVTDLAKHFAATWKDTDVSGIAPADMAKVHPSAWKAAPVEAYAGFTVQNFATVPPANMHEMTLQKLSAISNEARAVITEDQAKEIGQAVQVADPSKEHPLLAFNGITLPEAIRKAIDGRLGAAQKKPEEPTPP